MRSEIFISHHANDRPWLERLRVHLAPWVRKSGLTVWDATCIQPGQDREAAITQALAQARVAVLLVSPDYLASDFIADVELPILFERAERGALRLLWIALRACGYKQTQIVHYHPANSPEEPLAELPGAEVDKKLEAVCWHVQTAVLYPEDDRSAAGARHEIYHRLSMVRALSFWQKNEPNEEVRAELTSVGAFSAVYAPILSALRAGVERSAVAELCLALEPDVRLEVVGHLLAHPSPTVRGSAARLAGSLGSGEVIPALLSALALEKDSEVRRALVWGVRQAGGALPENVAWSLLESENDWIICSHALAAVEDRRSCLLVGDGSVFAEQLGAMVREAGFRVVSADSAPLLEWSVTEVDLSVLRHYQLILVVRGEHFSYTGTQRFYSTLLAYVHQGGTLLATPWVAWEAQHHSPQDELLPFAFKGPRESSVGIHENRPSTIVSADGQHVVKNVAISYEPLSARDGTEVGAVIEDGCVPFWGSRRYGKGLSCYLNVCQHDCKKTMPSPLNNDSPMRPFVRRLVRGLIDRCRSEPQNA